MGNITSGTLPPCATVFRELTHWSHGQQKPGPPDIFHWNPGGLRFRDPYVMVYEMIPIPSPKPKCRF